MDPIKPLDGLSELLRKQIAREVAAKSASEPALKTTERQAALIRSGLYGSAAPQNRALGRGDSA